MKKYWIIRDIDMQLVSDCNWTTFTMLVNHYHPLTLYTLEVYLG